MGGTTAKMCLIDNGRPIVKHDFEAGRLSKFKQGSGLPLKITVIDMIEIGSGGGSIAALDTMGLMKVGPRSATSVPGPVAYGRGGTEPTVTDADLLLGNLDPEFFLGGEMKLDVSSVRDAVARRLATPLGLGVADAARGIQDIVNENMAAATRMYLAEKGKDPRAYTLFAFGGAGSVHAYALARLLKVRRLIVPMGAGVISAFGFLVAPPAADQVRGYLTPLQQADWPLVNRNFAEMEGACRALLAGARDADAPIEIRRQADMRYVGQGFEISVTLPAGALGAQDVDAIEEAFRAAYQQRFGRVVRGVALEVVNWRVSAQLPERGLTLAYSIVDGPASRGSRPVHFPGFGTVSTPVYDRYALRPGTVLAGPAVIEERESSCSVGPDCTFSIDAHYNLVVEFEPAARAHPSQPAHAEEAAT
jgi:N-methylhydantoinase A